MSYHSNHDIYGPKDGVAADLSLLLEAFSDAFRSMTDRKVESSWSRQRSCQCRF